MSGKAKPLRGIYLHAHQMHPVLSDYQIFPSPRFIKLISFLIQVFFTQAT